MDKGDFVIWSSNIPHSGGVNTLKDHWRFFFYIFLFFTIFFFSFFLLFFTILFFLSSDCTLTLDLFPLMPTKLTKFLSKKTYNIKKWSKKVFDHSFVLKNFQQGMWWFMEVQNFFVFFFQKSKKKKIKFRRGNRYRRKRYKK